MPKLKIVGYIAAAAFAGAFLFLPYRTESDWSSDVTGSFRTSSRWFAVIPFWSTYPSPLLLWCQQHNVPVQEHFRQMVCESYALFWYLAADGHRTAASAGFPQEYQAVYVKHENEAAIRAYVAAMMAEPDEKARRKLADSARRRAEELAELHHEKLEGRYPPR